MMIERLVETHYGVVFAIALAALRDRETAEEMAQEVFLRAILHVGQMRCEEAWPA